MTNQTKNNNLNYLIDPTFTKVDRTSFFKVLRTKYSNKRL